ncbi:MAG: hypothetical protein ACREHC_06765 [Candidatus Levyibacteriota bacterium]
MTAKHLSVGIIIFVLGTFIGTGQTLFVQNLPAIQHKYFPQPVITSPIPTFTPTPTASPSATPTLTPTPTIIRYRYIAPTAVPTL